jgi:hypothetical protein
MKPEESGIPPTPFAPSAAWSGYSPVALFFRSANARASPVPRKALQTAMSYLLHCQYFRGADRIVIAKRENFSDILDK